MNPAESGTRRYAPLEGSLILGAVLAVLGLVPLLAIGIADLDWRHGLGPQLAAGLAELGWQQQALMLAGAAVLIAGCAILVRQAARKR